MRHSTGKAKACRQVRAQSGTLCVRNSGCSKNISYGVRGGVLGNEA